MDIPIIFNTDMVKAILDDRKTSTRRIIKYRHGGTPAFYKKDKFYGLFDELNGEKALFSGFYCDSDIFIYEGEKHIDAIYFKAPYKIGDTLWVRETWQKWKNGYVYKADGMCPKGIDRWRPSIHMPKAAARLFLKVVDVRVQRLQDITENESMKEGIIYPVVDAANNILDNGYRLMFSDLWNSIYKNWDENPWVWVVDFQRI